MTDLPFNIWLPLPDIHDSVDCLATAHLTIQRYQVVELVEHLLGIPEDDSVLPSDYERTSLKDQPIVEMWRGHVPILTEIGLVCSERWMKHTHSSDTLYTELSRYQEVAVSGEGSMEYPSWWGEPDVHVGHQAALIRANATHYQKHFHPNIQGHIIYPRSAYA